MGSTPHAMTVPVVSVPVSHEQHSDPPHGVVSAYVPVSRVSYEQHLPSRAGLSGAPVSVSVSGAPIDLSGANIIRGTSFVPPTFMPATQSLLSQACLPERQHLDGPS